MKKFISFIFTTVLCTSLSFTQNIKNLFWETPVADEGKEINLIAEVSDTKANQIISFKVFPAGKNEASCAPYAVFEVPVINGEAKASWKYQRANLDEMPKKNPMFIATASSGTEKIQTKNPLEVKLNRITIKNVKWLDENFTPAKKNVMGHPMIASAEVYGEVNEVLLKIKDLVSGEIKLVAELPIENNKVHLGFIYEWDGFYHDKKPLYGFEIEVPGYPPVKSNSIEVSMTYEKKVTYEDGTPIDDLPYTVLLMNGKTIKGKTDENGKIIIKNLIPGKLNISIEDF